MKLLLASALVLTACRPPSTGDAPFPEGPIPLVVTNNTSEEMCTAEISPDYNTMPNVGGLYIADTVFKKTQSFKAGQTFRANVKPGKYSISAENCTNTVATQEPTSQYAFDVTGPTSVGLGAEDANAPSGYKRVSVPMMNTGGAYVPHPDPANCAPRDTPQPFPADEAKCCSGRIYYNGTDQYHPFCA
jgi:hypothetical protein